MLFFSGKYKFCISLASAESFASRPPLSSEFKYLPVMFLKQHKPSLKKLVFEDLRNHPFVKIWMRPSCPHLTQLRHSLTEFFAIP